MKNNEKEWEYNCRMRPKICEQGQNINEIGGDCGSPSDYLLMDELLVDLMVALMRLTAAVLPHQLPHHSLDRYLPTGY